MQSSHQNITTNKLFAGRMPFLSPNQQCQSTEGMSKHCKDRLVKRKPNVVGMMWISAWSTCKDRSFVAVSRARVLHTGSRVVRIDVLRFLAGCRTR